MCTLGAVFFPLEEEAYRSPYRQLTGHLRSSLTGAPISGHESLLTPNYENRKISLEENPPEKIHPK